MEIPSGVYDVLTDTRTVISGERVQIPFELDRAQYEQVNKVLKEIGGRWDGRNAVRAHVFPFPVEEFMRACLATREFPSRYEQGWYPTPTRIVHDILEHANIKQGMSVLEPSAGTGSIVGPHGRTWRGRRLRGGRRAARACPPRAGRRPPRGRGGLPRPRPARLPARLPPGTDEPAVRGGRAARHPRVRVPRRRRHAHRGHARVGHVAQRPGDRRVPRADRPHRGEFIPLPDEAFVPSGTSVRTVLLVVDAEQGGPLPTHGWHQRQPRQLDLFALAGPGLFRSSLPNQIVKIGYGNLIWKECK